MGPKILKKNETMITQENSLRIAKKSINTNKNEQYNESFIRKMEMISKEESIPFDDPKELFD